MNNPLPEKVKTFIFDVDNTLIDTTGMFVEMFSRFKTVLREVYDEKKAEEVHDEFYEELHGGKYDHTVDYHYISGDFGEFLQERDGISDEDRGKIESCLVSIYDLVPPNLDFASELLDLVYEKGYTIAFWTHSGAEWADLKVKGLLKGTKVPFEDVFVFSIALSDHKDLGSLDYAIKTLSVSPEEVVVVGDNIITDIKSAVDVGVKDVVWFRNGTPRGVSVQEEAEHIDDVVDMRVVSGLDQLISIVNAS
jgi:FMN phosphatase YigB (HAD superfamily)